MKKPRILIFTPFRNEDHVIPLYVDALKKLDYPRKLIDLYWVENDSGDKTLEMLEEAIPTMPFNSTHLDTILIHGPYTKPPVDTSLGTIKVTHPIREMLEKGYRKALLSNREKVAMAHMILWNDCLIPTLKTSRADYVLFCMADALPPPNVITEYLKVYDQKPDVGWVGGKCHRRAPLHHLLCSPIPVKIVNSKEPVLAKITAHCWLNPREALLKTEMYDSQLDRYYSIVNELAEQGLKVYYQPSVYLTHVSTDGKIYRTNDEQSTPIGPYDP